MKRMMIFIIPAVLCAGLNFSQEEPERRGRDRWYRAVEFSVTETAPVNISLKAGLKTGGRINKKIYASFHFSYNQFAPVLSSQVFYGMGFGSILSGGGNFFFNPEFIFTKGAGRNRQIRFSLVPFFGFSLPLDMEILFGPALSWTREGKNRTPPFLKMFEYKINGRQTLSLSCRVALRLLW
jgi:hypothetical protein